jgi:hypothetical protein
VVAFCRGDAVGLGEVIAEITDEGAAFGLPVSCLAAGAAEVDGYGLLDLLVDHPSCVVLVDEPALWRDLAAALPFVDRFDVASAAVIAGRFAAYILTRRPGWYVKLPSVAPIIEV